MTIDWIKLTDEALSIAGSIISGAALAYVALRIYFRQKEYELVKERYLEKSADVVAGELEEITSVFLHNWAHTLELVKELRDTPSNFDPDHLKSGFLPFRGSNINHAAHHRLAELLGSKTLWECYQLALVRHMAMNNVAAVQIPHAISEQLAGRLPDAEPQDVVDEAYKELEPMMAQSAEFGLLQEAVQRISSELAGTRLSFAGVREFAERANIRKIVIELQEQYGEQLKEDDDEGTA